MLSQEIWMDIKLLHKQGLSVRKIAKQTGHSRNTIRKALSAATPASFAKPARSSGLDSFKPYLRERYEQYGLSAIRLREEIRAMGYSGSVDPVRRFLRPLRQALLHSALATVRFETPPGQQAQVDWGYCGRHPTPSGDSLPIYVFVMVLGFSRMAYVEFTNTMSEEALIGCHVHAFEFFGGWPKEMLYDNMAQVKLPAGGWNPVFTDFASHYGIAVHTCRVRRPRTKGKVERGVGYVKDSFLNGRSFEDMTDLGQQGRLWLDQTANVRIHGTTGKRPIDLLAEEQLTPLTAAPVYRFVAREARKADVEGFIHLCGSRYSVPPEHVGKSLVVEHNGQTVRVRLGDVIVAEHLKAVKTGSCLVKREHVEAMWKLTMGRSQAPPPHCSFEMTFSQDVSQTPLSAYDEATDSMSPPILSPPILSPPILSPPILSPPSTSLPGVSPLSTSLPGAPVEVGL